VRINGTMARRIFAGAFLAVVMTLSLAGIASAQGSGSGSGAGGATTTTSASIRAGSTARTGINAGILLLVGGGLTVAVLGARRIARASATN
jgi:hypothetical protein